MIKLITTFLLALLYTTATAQQSQPKADTLTATDTITALSPEPAADADIPVAGPVVVSEQCEQSFPWLWISLPVVAFLAVALAYRNVRRRYERTKERLDDAEQQLSDVRLLQNADKEQVYQQLQQMEEEKAGLTKARADAEKAWQQAEKEVEKLLEELKGQQAENDQLCDKNMQLSKQLRLLNEQYDQLKASRNLVATDEQKFVPVNGTDKTEKAVEETDCRFRMSQCVLLLDALCQQVQQTEGTSPVISATLRQMQSSMREMMQALETASPHSLQEIFVKYLRPSGWMNHTAQLFAYSRLPQLCQQLQQSGVHIATLEQLTGQVQALLGAADMSMTIPAVLATHFDRDAYNYQNGDVWINKMFSGITQRDYEGKVFDILQVGYTIGKAATKPIVNF